MNGRSVSILMPDEVLGPSLNSLRRVSLERIRQKARQSRGDVRLSRRIGAGAAAGQLHPQNNI